MKNDVNNNIKNIGALAAKIIQKSCQYVYIYIYSVTTSTTFKGWVTISYVKYAYMMWKKRTIEHV